MIGRQRSLSAGVAWLAVAALLAGLTATALVAHPALAAYPAPGVLPYGDAAQDGGPASVNAPVVAMAAAHGGLLGLGGYWLAAADGAVYNFGAAGNHGGADSVALNAPIVGMAATADGGGYWLVAIDGGIFNFGDAAFLGSTGNIRLNDPIVGMAATPDGRGYWLVADDGGIFAFGDARFFGSTGGMHLNAPIVGMAATPDGGGYWLVANDGGIFAFGDAGFYGSPAAGKIQGWVSGIAPTHDGRGYWISNEDGQVYNFGDAPHLGDNSAAPEAPPIAAITATPDGAGYWLLEPDAFPTTFNHPGGGDQAVVSVAAGQIGPDPDAGQGTGCNPYGPCEPWCALFATWVWEHSSASIPNYGFVGTVYQWAIRHTGVRSPRALAEPGDLVLYGTGPQNGDTAPHMAVVAQVWPDGAIDTIDGDSGPGPEGHHDVTMNGPFLPANSAVINGMGIFGFAEP